MVVDGLVMGPSSETLHTSGGSRPQPSKCLSGEFLNHMNH
ncbi:MAG: hypothetical protein QOI40_5646, partial [Alphaproteobacteria bacterium]|nr:hypothetical protein [Alphaproteobacteria bacterium]